VNINQEPLFVGLALYIDTIYAVRAGKGERSRKGRLIKSYRTNVDDLEEAQAEIVASRNRAEPGYAKVIAARVFPADWGGDVSIPAVAEFDEAAIDAMKKPPRRVQPAPAPKAPPAPKAAPAQLSLFA
jgi:hypothetical protein